MAEHIQYVQRPGVFDTVGIIVTVNLEIFVMPNFCEKFFSGYISYTLVCAMELKTLCCLRVYHVYRDNWEAATWEVLSCE